MVSRFNNLLPNILIRIFSACFELHFIVVLHLNIALKVININYIGFHHLSSVLSKYSKQTQLEKYVISPFQIYVYNNNITTAYFLLSNVLFCGNRVHYGGFHVDYIQQHTELAGEPFFWQCSTIHSLVVAANQR